MFLISCSALLSLEIALYKCIFNNNNNNNNKKANSIEDNHKSTVFSVSGKFIASELFLVAIFLIYVFQIICKPTVFPR